MIFRHLFKNGVSQAETELAKKLAETDAMKSIARAVYNFVEGTKEQARYNPNDPQTFHLRDEEGNAPQHITSSPFKALRAAKAAVTAAVDTIANDIQNDIIKKK